MSYTAVSCSFFFTFSESCDHKLSIDTLLNKLRGNFDVVEVNLNLKNLKIQFQRQVTFKA